tara:strand:+ start:15137 stop:15358 length:222 start_codon:yes stop_codon:yes gene_type:complete
MKTRTQIIFKIAELKKLRDTHHKELYAMEPISFKYRDIEGLRRTIAKIDKDITTLEWVILEEIEPNKLIRGND